MKYRIFEGNMERLEKKLQRISNKCKKYNNNFSYEKVGEEFEEYTDENGGKHTKRFILVEVEGTAIINNWQYVASVEHTEKGNILKKNPCINEEIPERYYNSKCYCEHCNSNRYRKNTFIVQNTITKEFKQVGKSCLNDFTGGLSAEYVASYISLFDDLIEFEKIEGGYHATEYINKIEAMQYIAETIRHFGYIKTDDERPTKTRSLQYWKVNHGFYTGLFSKIGEELKEEMLKVSFNHESDYSKELVKNVLKWINEQDENNNYFHNLKVITSLDYITFDKFGLLASVFPSYNKYLVRKEEKEKKEAQEKVSVHVGDIGKRINVKVESFNIVTSWDTMYGTTYIYKIVDTNGNIYTWKTSGGIADETKEIIGTVKAHNEFKGIKQTELTRCRKVC